MTGFARITSLLAAAATAALISPVSAADNCQIGSTVYNDIAYLHLYSKTDADTSVACQIKFNTASPQLLIAQAGSTVFQKGMACGDCIRVTNTLQGGSSATVMIVDTGHTGATLDLSPDAMNAIAGTSNSAQLGHATVSYYKVPCPASLLTSPSIKYRFKAGSDGNPYLGLMVVNKAVPITSVSISPSQSGTFTPCSMSANNWWTCSNHAALNFNGGPIFYVKMQSVLGEVIVDPISAIYGADESKELPSATGAQFSTMPAGCNGATSSPSVSTPTAAPTPSVTVAPSTDATPSVTVAPSSDATPSATVSPSSNATPSATVAPSSSSDGSASPSTSSSSAACGTCKGCLWSYEGGQQCFPSYPFAACQAAASSDAPYKYTWCGPEEETAVQAVVNTEASCGSCSGCLWNYGSGTKCYPDFPKVSCDASGSQYRWCGAVSMVSVDQVDASADSSSQAAPTSSVLIAVVCAVGVLAAAMVVVVHRRKAAARRQRLAHVDFDVISPVVSAFSVHEGSFHEVRSAKWSGTPAMKEEFIRRDAF